MKTLSMVALLLLLGNSHVLSQQTSMKSRTAETPTAQNVLAWAKELSPKLKQLSPRLQKIKPQKQKDIAAKESILQVQQRLEEILKKGKRLTAGEAAQHDKWFRNVMSEGLQDCLERNPGSECCFSGQYGGHGWGSLWSLSNCFVSNFPDVN